ncbi:hypothetical protein CB17B2539 [Clostridium botulinum B str. Eklund 17B (NRP)]|nr:hypothetical protein CB17B2539 [Clostridium botulinum B str. Eklund 17B (NRP)]
MAYLYLIVIFLCTNFKHAKYKSCAKEEGQSRTAHILLWYSFGVKERYGQS